MPNHEENHVVITGTKDQVDAAYAALVTTASDDSLPATPHVSFEGVIPMPEELRGTTSPTQPGADMAELAELARKYGATNWYDWSVNHWGTKWDAYGEQQITRVRDDRLDLYFQTAWSAPTPVFAKLEAEYGVEVHALTIDEGGFDDVEYGTPHEYMYVERVVHVER